MNIHGLSLGLPYDAPKASFVGALDNFTTNLQECWSHRRKLVKTAPSTVMQVRRTSDDVPLNVTAGANGEIDSAGMLSFAGSNSLAVASLTGQVNGLDLLQNTGSLQRIVVDSGTLLTVGGKAASRGLRTPAGSGTGGVLKTSPFTAYTGTKCSVFIRGKHDAYSGIFTLIVDNLFALGSNGNGSAASHPGLSHAPGGGVDVTWLGRVSSPEYAADYLLSCIWDGANLKVRDGTSTWTFSASSSFDFNKFILGAFDDVTTDYASDANRIQEAAIWYSDQTANEAAIRSAMLA